MARDTKQLVRDWFQKVWNERSETGIGEMMAADAIGHMEGGDVHGPEAFAQQRAAFLSALPDLHITVEDVIAEGEKAAVRWHVTGTHKGDGLGIAPSHAPVSLRGTSWFRIRDGKFVEGWDTWNFGGMMESLRSQSRARA
jgi:steroid delta-isomerase-like uncharacterized protein